MIALSQCFHGDGLQLSAETALLLNACRLIHYMAENT